MLFYQLHIDEGLLCVESRRKQEGAAQRSGKRSKEELDQVGPFEDAGSWLFSEEDRDAVDFPHDRGEWYLMSVRDSGGGRPPVVIKFHGAAEPGVVLVELKGHAKEELLRSCHGVMAENQTEKLDMSWGIPESGGGVVLQVQVKVLQELLPCMQGPQPHETQHCISGLRSACLSQDGVDACVDS